MLTEQGLLGVDPSIAVAVGLAQAEVLRIEAELALTVERPSDPVWLRDLSPLGQGVHQPAP